MGFQTLERRDTRFSNDWKTGRRETGVPVDIDEATVRSATLCEKGFACLECEDQVYCTVEQCLMHRIHFIRCADDLPCPYKKQLDGVPVCACPVRKAIFDRYGL
jgi:hypothetical protein